MRYRPKSIAALNIALGGLPAQMRVEVESGIEIRAKTVGDLRSNKPTSRSRRSSADVGPMSDMRVEQFGPSVGRLKPGHMRPSYREALRALCFWRF